MHRIPSTVAMAMAALLLAVSASPAASQDPPSQPTTEDTRALRKEIEQRQRELREDERALREQERARERARRKRSRPGLVWFNVGGNVASIDGGQHNCSGIQYGVSFGSKLIVRLQHAGYSYENDDDSGDCDGLVAGDSSASEDALLAGFALGRSGFFVAAGPSKVDVERPGASAAGGLGPWGGDTGTRYEFGWNSRHSNPSPVGVEFVVFKNDNEVRDLHGVAVNLVFGPRR